MQGSGSEFTSMQSTGLAKCKPEEIRQHARQWDDQLAKHWVGKMQGRGEEIRQHARQWVDQHAKHWVGKMQGSGVGKDARQWNQTLYHSFVMNHDSLHACVIIVRYCEPLYP